MLNTFSALFHWKICKKGYPWWKRTEISSVRYKRKQNHQEPDKNSTTHWIRSEEIRPLGNAFLKKTTESIKKKTLQLFQCMHENRIFKRVQLLKTSQMIIFGTTNVLKMKLLWMGIHVDDNLEKLFFKLWWYDSGGSYANIWKTWIDAAWKVLKDPEKHFRIFLCRPFYSKVHDFRMRTD